MPEISDAVHIVSLIAALAIKLCGLIVGYLVVRLGYDALEKGLKGEFELLGKVPGQGKVVLRSVSPGLLFVFLGICLAGVVLCLDHPVGVSLVFTEEQDVVAFEVRNQNYIKDIQNIGAESLGK